ncbi:arrestin domain-containing protein 17-like [Mizuhopecten yessoensis]|uniref:Arrestin domain-containing protein 3 n=1 Tax=Mizuhopecten yessoensis TaxID=6573 RepID=A0A210PE39_MIZYE|nr:arrestin domain-containing protein 17-like [Mizuhopecten yessoensis]OWF34734.1 Arrestin domain-containing protein 3 [Mizuhopecten yessoensis]
MKLTLFDIKFESQLGVFDAGSEIIGQIIINLERPMKMRRITIYFEGKGKSYWDVRSGKHTTKYRGHENYLNHTILVFGSGQSADNVIEHPAGHHVYPFTLPLPSTIPSSFEGRRGYVRYTCKANIDRPWKFDESTKRAFTVIRHLDLNTIPNILMPERLVEQETIQGCCCEEGKVKVTLGINKRGYVPGEHLVYDIEVENNSENTISFLSLELRQEATYTGYSDSLFSSGNPHYHQKVDTFNLVSGNLSIPQGATKTFHQASVVPSLPPSKLEGCQIVDIIYNVVLKVPCGWSTLKLVQGIIIGTIPARMPAYTPPTVPSAPDTEFSSIGPDPSMQPPAYTAPDEPPPSYAECVFGRVTIQDENDDEHTGGESSWAPAYPYYDWSRHSNQTYGGAQATVPRMAPPAYGD